jgi:hypothetical protein
LGKKTNRRNQKRNRESKLKGELQKSGTIRRDKKAETAWKREVENVIIT